MNKHLIALCCLLCVFGSTVARAQTEDGGLAVQAEQQRIATERQQIEQRFNQEESACFQKFAVNDCRNKNRAHRRALLSDLRRQEILLNDAERKRKGALQLQRMEQSQVQDGPAPAASAAGTETKPAVRVRTPAAPRQPHDPAQAARAQAERKATLEKKNQANQQERAAHDSRAATAPDERARYEKKLQEAAAHKEQTRQRNAANTKPKPAPLPLPSP